LFACFLLLFLLLISISPFISMECPSLSHLINVSLKSTLSEINIATLPVFRAIGFVILLPAFHSQPVLISVNEVGPP
jgi:hypothetical protein